MSKPRAIIVDMDGTLANVSSIRHHLIPTDPKYKGYKDFNAFHEESVNCPAHDWVVEDFKYAQASGFKVIVVTARQEKYRPHTSWWLSEQNLVPDEHYHRANGDFRKDVEIKREILERIRKRYDVVHAYDDNPAIIELWKSEGIETTIVPGWEYENTTR